MRIELDPAGIVVLFPRGLTLLVSADFALWTLDGRPLRWVAIGRA
jgi:hypothetical protein